MLREIFYDTYKSIVEIKSSILLKNRHFIIQERFNELIYGINTIIKYSTCKILVSLSFLKRNDFYRIFELMLPTLIQKYDKSHFIFDPVQTRETN